MEGPAGEKDEACSNSPKSSSSPPPLGASGLAAKLSENEDWKAKLLADEATVGRNSSLEKGLDLKVEPSVEKGPQSPSCAGRPYQRKPAQQHQ